MGVEDRVVSLIDRIYVAALDPPEWQGFVDDLADWLDDPVVIMNLQLPDSTQPGAIYRHGIDARRLGIFARYLESGRLPWLPMSFYKGRFRFGDEQIPNEELRRHDYYREWFEPHGLPAESPLANLIAEHHGRPMSVLALFRTQRGRPFTAADVESLDVLVPHLARAYQIHLRDRARQAAENVIDRLSIGIILLDRLHRPVLTNRSADRLLALDDGLSLTPEGLRASDARTDATLQALIARAVAEGTVPHDPPHTVLSIPRTSGGREFPLYVSPVLPSIADSTLLDAAVTISTIDPDLGGAPSEATLMRLFDLARAEAEVVRLLANGYSLEAVAEHRGVSMHTIRSQLKNVFAKTRTKKQSELLRLVLLTGREMEPAG